MMSNKPSTTLHLDKDCNNSDVKESESVVAGTSCDDGASNNIVYGPTLPDGNMSLNKKVEEYLNAEAQDSSNKDIKDAASVPGICGLNNLGNTCFMNAGLQCLLANSNLLKYFLEQHEQNASLSESMTPTLTCKFSILVKKAWSGKYACLHPLFFKETVGIYHPQFRNYRQHDSQEFLALLLDSLHEELNEKNLQHDRLRDEVDCFMEDDVESERSVSHSVSPATLTSEDSNHSTHRYDPVPQNVSRFNSMSTVLSGNNLLGSDNNSFDDNEDGVMQSSSCFMISTETLVGYDADQEVQCDGAATVVTTKPNNSNQYFMQVASNNSNKRTFLAADSTPKSLNLHSIEEFYMKDSKTKNINVAGDESLNDEIKTDSEKFSVIHENIDDCVNINSTGFEAAAKCSYKNIIKDTNLIANTNRKSKLNSSVLDGSMSVECGINNIKRMRVDDKHVNINNATKVNLERNVTHEAKPDANNLSPYLSNSGSSPTCSTAANNLVNIETPTSPSKYHVNQLQSSTSVRYTKTHKDDLHAVADNKWEKYVSKNATVVVDTFQGQFKSTVVCSGCDHVSVTFEPFMYLSVPLPHAMEKQIPVIFVPCDGQTPVRYLVTVNKMDQVAKIKSKLLNFISWQCQILLAEVFENHVSRILDDSLMVRYMKENRLTYAFELSCSSVSMSCAPDSPFDYVDHGNNDDASSITANPPRSPIEWEMFDDSLPVLSTNEQPCLSDDNDSITKMETSSSEGVNYSSEFMFVNPMMKSATAVDDDGCQDDVDNIHSSTDTLINKIDECVGSSCVAPCSDRNYLTSLSLSEEEEDSVDSVMLPLSVDIIEDTAVEDNPDIGDFEPAGGVGSPPPLQETVRTEDTMTVSAQWSSCAICLEEMLDSELMVHVSCGGMLCHTCLEMSVKHYGDGLFVCPVCSTSVDPNEEFVQLSINKSSLKTRILHIPVMLRLEEDDEISLFGHPFILTVTTVSWGQLVYDAVKNYLKINQEFTLSFTDGQGLHCSRCLYSDHCCGCLLSTDTEITFQPSDNIAVRFTSLTAEQLDHATVIVEHESMSDIRPNAPLTLQDCLTAFTESEVLDEQNPWYCSHCQKFQCAKKTMTVWRYPDTLVIYLKRFVFHDLSSTKIDTKVIFPIDGLDLDKFIESSSAQRENLVYDLQACVCHFGGVSSGHYTAYCKHPCFREWHYFNDETITQQRPREEDYSNGYILFYQQASLKHIFNLPLKNFFDDLEIGKSDFLGDTSTTALVPYRPRPFPPDSESVNNVAAISGQGDQSM